MSLPQENYETVKAASLTELAGLAIGVGVGLLLSDKFRRTARTGAAVALMVVGAATTVPFVWNFVARQISFGDNRHSMRRRLDTIRDASGLHDEAQAY